ncbi:hypothetical protein F2Q69_00029359 [Brassica cretica]|uniref:Uncharacterized protein n=1 Tax=Brassica cretica TaxID=69181 RepID=A0A8S9RWD6_BRACR|nr:hypothetical protein F2Q69_00029359 [Brassica cretica]
MYMSKASHLAVPKHQRPPIWTEEAAGFHKRLKRIHDPVKTVVPCAVFEAESPIPPDRSIQFSSHIEGPSEATSIDTYQIPSNDINKPASIDANPSPSIDSRHVSEQKEFDVCGNLRDGDITTRSDKSRGKKRRNWKKRKRIKDGPQEKLRGRRVCKRIDDGCAALIDDGCATSIDRASLASIDHHLTVSIDRASTVLIAT